ncbi:MAG: chemotaxis protein CheA [Deltaproteobacteria bacterium]|nr:chemotaxis protein CheA [Deltaproteobacteria bacterium]
MDVSQIRQTFVAESAELLQELENSLLILEGSPEDTDTIHSLFRAVHTIKGSAGVLGMEAVEKFAHAVESLLSKVRESSLHITKDIVALLLECRDHMAVLVDLSAAASASMPEDVAGQEMILIDRLRSMSPQALSGDLMGGEHGRAAQKHVPAGLERGEEGAAVKGTVEGCHTPQPPEGQSVPETRTDAWHISLRFSREILKNGMDPITLINYLHRLGAVVNLTSIFDSMPGAADMDPECCYLGLEIDLKTDAGKKKIDDAFEFIRNDATVHILAPHSRVESFKELIKSLPEDPVLLGEILLRGGTLTSSELKDALRTQDVEARSEGAASKRFIGEILVSEGAVYPEVVDAALEKQKKNQMFKSREISTLRIDASKLDTLVTLVGELVISSASIDQHSNRIQDPWLKESASLMLRLVEEVRESSMRLRMVPIGETFSRFNRVVRDLGMESGKDIRIVISGGDTELDKTVVEKINDPLMHIVRNAIDHGIETPAVRRESGKPEKATIRLDAYHDAGCIVIEVSDDGRGLDRDKIMQKAVSIGMASPGQLLPDNEIYGLIFKPGFSTADEVTKLSGRGVGMDVVKRNVEALRGTVEVKSKEGAGAAVVIRLPLTLAIIDGFMVGLDNSLYVMPLDMVVECVELGEADRHASSRRNYVNLRGEILPYLRLREIFDAHGDAPRYEHVVVVKYAGQKIGLVVDELLGEVQTVIKSLGRIYRDLQGISGATILGSGQVALILDVPRLVQAVQREAAASPA